MNGNYTILSPSAIEYLCGVLRDMDNVSEGLNDLAIQTDSTFSSYKISQLLADLENNVKLYSDDLVSHLTHLKLEMAADVSEVVKENTIYLVATATPNSYDQYVLVQDVPKNIGGTQIDLTNYLTKDDADAKYETIANVDDIRTAIGNDTLETEDKTIKGAINEVKQNIDDFNSSWNGTEAEFEALDKSTLKDGQLVIITDDYDEPEKLRYSNPNLLDNGWFTVNQRGQTAYTGVKYTVDRWKGSDAFDCTVNDNGITLNAVSGTKNNEIYNFIESDTVALLMGKTVTLSLMTPEGKIYTGTAKIPLSVPTAFTNVIVADIPNGKLVLSYSSSTTKWYARFYVTPGNTLSVRAVKLELGSVSTLANDTAPNYQQELAKCQRYYYKFYTPASSNSLAIGCGNSNTTNVFVNFVLPVPMRIKPTITINGNIRAIGNGAVINNTSPTITATAYYNGNNVKLDIGGFTGLSDKHLHNVETAGGEVSIEFSADL